MYSQHSIRSFVLRQGRMTAGQKRAMQKLWPVYGITADKQHIHAHPWFSGKHRIHLDIGFGMGHSLLQLACDNPQIRYVGVEVHTPGVGHVMSRLHQQNLSNVAIIHADISQVLAFFPPRIFEVAYILFPDPWPKKRQAKRRLVQLDFLRSLVSRMRPQAKIYLATDFFEYAQQMQSLATQTQGLRNLSEHGFLDLKHHRPATKYELRARRLGHTVWDLGYRVSD